MSAASTSAGNPPLDAYFPPTAGDGRTQAPEEAHDDDDVYDNENEEDNNAEEEWESDEGSDGSMPALVALQAPPRNPPHQRHHHHHHHHPHHPHVHRTGGGGMIPAPARGAGIAPAFSFVDRSSTSSLEGGSQKKSEGPRGREPTQADIEGRSCWICMEDAQPEDIAQGVRWVHPCNCSLVGHEKCILLWIAQQQQQNNKFTVACPSCKTIYKVKETQGRLLRIMNQCDGVIEQGITGALFGGLAASAVILSGVHGLSSMRLFFGGDAMRRILGNDGPTGWPWFVWVNAPLVPYALIASRIPTLQTFLTAIPLLALPRPFIIHGHRYLTSPTPMSDIDQLFSVQFQFPPNFGLVVAVFPLVRTVYVALKRKMYKLVFGLGNLKRRRSSTAGQDGEEDPHRQAHIDIVIGEDDFRELDNDLFGRNDDDDQDAQQQNEQAAEEEDAQPLEVRFLSRTSLARLVIGSLFLPAISALSGQLLLMLSRYSPVLRKVLGLRPVQQIGAGRLKLGLAGAGLGSGLGHAWKVLSGDNRGFTPDEIDPVWWRNTLGTCLFIVSKDAINLLHKYLKLKARRSRTIVSRGFSNLHA